MNSTKFIRHNAPRMIYGTSRATEQRATEQRATELATMSQTIAAQTLAESHPIQTQPACLLEGLSPAQRDQNRAEVLSRFGLMGSELVPVFDEATQTVSRLLAMPICVLSVIDASTQRFKSVVGLSSLGLMNQLASARSLPREESFCTHVVDSGKTFALDNATAHPAFSHSLLVQQYGIQSYLGVPMIAADGCCIGTLAVMDLLPHQFTQQEVALLELSARWCMSEFEKRHVINELEAGTHPLQSGGSSLSAEESLLAKINQVRFDLVVQLTQDLRNPLTSITGMANMLSREIYGPLSAKQKEYASIVVDSSQQLLAMVDEIVEVGDIKEEGYKLALASVDMEMIGQQAIAALSTLAKQQDLQIKLTVEPGSRMWNLDRRVIKQLIYHLVFSIIKMSAAGSTIRLHISRKEESINLALWVSNPWLGEDLPPAVIAWGQSNSFTSSYQLDAQQFAARSATVHPDFAMPGDELKGEDDAITAIGAIAQKVDTSRQELGLLLSRHLTEIHCGKAVVQGSAATGYRYVITLPSLEIPE